MEGSESGCNREGTAGPSAPLGMTRFRWWRTFALVIRMKGSESGCNREGTAGPSAPLGMTRFGWVTDLGIGYSDGGFSERLQPKGHCRSLGSARDDKV